VYTCALRTIFLPKKCTRLRDFPYTISKFFPGSYPRAPAARGPVLGHGHQFPLGAPAFTPFLCYKKDHTSSLFLSHRAAGVFHVPSIIRTKTSLKWVVYHNSGFTPACSVLEWWLARTGCRDRRFAYAPDCRLRFSRHWWPHPTTTPRTPVTTIPIHSRDQRKPPFCYTILKRFDRGRRKQCRAVRELCRGWWSPAVRTAPSECHCRGRWSAFERNATWSLAVAGDVASTTTDGCQSLHQPTSCELYKSSVQREMKY